MADSTLVTNRVQVGASVARQMTRAADMAADQMAAGMAVRDWP
ncbi:hypothetical protein [Streptomyces griseofuscus]|nr:hypothetical protein [Streptomyces griseofuscus]